MWKSNSDASCLILWIMSCRWRFVISEGFSLVSETRMFDSGPDSRVRTLEARRRPAPLPSHH